MAGQSGGFSLSDIGTFGEQLFGTSESAKVKSSGTTTKVGTTKERLNLDEPAISRIIQEVLGGSQGLANIFGTEQGTGLYNTSAAKAESGDLIAQLVGELAKLTAEKEQTIDTTETTKSKQKTEGGSGGLINQVFGGLF